MDFDFLNLYRDFTNAELLHIVRNPHQYQSDAVLAAQSVLAGRDVPETEANLAVPGPVNFDPETESHGQPDDQGHVVTEFLDDIINSPETRGLKRAINGVVALKAFAFLSFTYSVLYNLYRSKWADFIDYYAHLIWIYPAVVSGLATALLFARKKWGWILAMLDAVRIGCIFFTTVYKSVAQGRLHSITVYLALVFLLNGLIIYVLFRKDVCRVFKISAETQIRTLLGSIALYIISDIYL